MDEGGGREENEVERGGEKVRDNGKPRKSTKISIKAGFILSNIFAEMNVFFLLFLRLFLSFY